MIVFLDFDGTTHPTSPGVGVDTYIFCRLPLLESWLRQRPGVEIVISSSWREAHSLDELRGFFSEDLQGRVIGATPIIKRDARKGYDGLREREVRRWLSESGEPWRQWAALDDQAWLFKPFNSRLVLCDGKVGLTQEVLARLGVVLALPAPKNAQAAGRSDMVDTAEAAALAGVTPVQMRQWASTRHPKVICLRLSRLKWRYPAWQFGPAIWPVAQQLAQALGGNAWAALAWLETPHGALNGRTPRAALEQGELAERVLDIAGFDGT